MNFFRMLSVVLFFWGIIELLTGITGLCRFGVDTSHSVYVGIACIVLGLVMHFICKIVRKVRKNKYID